MAQSVFVCARRFAFLFVALGFLMSQAVADETVDIGPAANWIEFVDIPKADPERRSQIRNGISNLLSDYQFKHRDGGYTRLDRFAYQIVDRPGLEKGAGIDLEFDPSRHKVTLNRLNIIRDGVTFDRLPETRFDIFRREKDSENGVYDGWLTAHVDIADVRIGDIIDYAATFETTPIVGKSLFAERFAAAWHEPVSLIREKIIWPKAHPLEIRERNASVKPAVSSADTDTTYLWEIWNPDPVKYEENLPTDYPPLGGVDISSTRDWQDVVDAVLPFYQPETALPASFVARLDEIASRYPEPADRMVEALRLVQDEIRYVSRSIGPGAYIPRRPEAVLASSYGDCKDKALLLASALGYLGIDAQVALTNLDYGKSLDRLSPSLWAFDHAIVKAIIGDRVHWLDATSYLNGGRADNLAVPAYGFALPMVPSKAALEKIQSSQPSEPTIFVEERFVLPLSDGGPLKLNVVTKYSGADADYMRRRLARDGISKIADNYLEYYAGQYHGIKSSAPLETKDDREANIISIFEAYELSGAVLKEKGLIRKFPLRADIGESNLPTPAKLGRVGPVALGDPVFRRHKVTITNLKTRFVGPENADVTTPELSLKLSWASTPNELEIAWNFRTLADRVPAATIENYLKSVDEIKRNVEWTYDFTQKDAEPVYYDTGAALIVGSAIVLSTFSLFGFVFRRMQAGFQ
jgi:transglutaminase-like putative cysteine protease